MLILKSGKQELAFKVLDLTHALTSKAPTWSGTCGFSHRVIVDYPEACRVQAIEMNAGVGTHLDAPSHFIPGAPSVADLPLEDLIKPLVLIDITAKAAADYYLSAEDVLEFERKEGLIEADSLVVVRTGWERHWLEPERYRNADDKGQMHFPGVSKEAAAQLLDREVAGLGIDSLSPDCLDLSFPVHHLFLGAGKYIVENLAHCEQLPAKGAYGFMMPIKTVEGTEALMRAFALIPIS